MLALLLLLLVFPLVEGCERVDNTFVVNDVGGSVASAELRLCGSGVELSRSGAGSEAQSGSVAKVRVISWSAYPTVAALRATSAMSRRVRNRASSSMSKALSA
jgi:hypothetical protein